MSNQAKKRAATTRSTSTSLTRDPDPPEDPPNTMHALPETISAARKLLLSHKYIDKKDEDVSIYTLIGIMSRTARLPGIPAQHAAIIESVTHLLPLALAKAQPACEVSDAVLTKLEEIMSKQISALGSLDEKLSPICEFLTGVQDVVARAETSAASAEKSMQALHESLSWKHTSAVRRTGNVGTLVISTNQRRLGQSLFADGPASAPDTDTDTAPVPASPASSDPNAFSSGGMHPDRQAHLSGRSATFAGAISQPPSSRPPPHPYGQSAPATTSNPARLDSIAINHRRYVKTNTEEALEESEVRWDSFDSSRLMGFLSGEIISMAPVCGDEGRK